MTIPDENIEPETKEVSAEDELQEPKETEERPPKFKFECQRTGDCCKRENIPVSINDLQAWVKDQTIFRVAYFIELKVEEDEMQLHLSKDDDGYCKLYHRDNKACNIHYNKPLYCKSYPLSYNGENYVINSKECTGLGKGKMTIELLVKMKVDAKAYYYSRRLTADVLPIFQGIFYRQLAEESKKFMDKLTPEEKKKYEELLKQEKKE